MFVTCCMQCCMSVSCDVCSVVCTCHVMYIVVYIRVVMLPSSPVSQHTSAPHLPREHATISSHIRHTGLAPVPIIIPPIDRTTLHLEEREDIPSKMMQKQQILNLLMNHRWHPEPSQKSLSIPNPIVLNNYHYMSIPMYYFIFMSICNLIAKKYTNNKGMADLWDSNTLSYVS